MVGANLIIRDYAPADLERLHEIRTAAFKPVYASFREIVGERVAPYAFDGEEEAQGKYLDELCAGGEVNSVHVAVADERIVGFVGVKLDRARSMGEIGLAAVDPGHAGQGIGTALCEFALQLMREAGMKAALVATGGDPSHAPARQAYFKVGFDKVLPTQWMYQEL